MRTVVSAWLAAAAVVVLVPAPDPAPRDPWWCEGDLPRQITVECP